MGLAMSAPQNYRLTLANCPDLVGIQVAEAPSRLVNGDAQRAASPAKVVGRELRDGSDLAIAQDIPNAAIWCKSGRLAAETWRESHPAMPMAPAMRERGRADAACNGV